MFLCRLSAPPLVPSDPVRPSMLPKRCLNGPFSHRNGSQGTNLQKSRSSKTAKAHDEDLLDCLEFCISKLREAEPWQQKCRWKAWVCGAKKNGQTPNPWMNKSSSCSDPLAHTFLGNLCLFFVLVIETKRQGQVLCMEPSVHDAVLGGCVRVFCSCCVSEVTVIWSSISLQRPCQAMDDGCGSKAKSTFVKLSFSWCRRRSYILEIEGLMSWSYSGMRIPCQDSARCLESELNRVFGSQQNGSVTCQDGTDQKQGAVGKEHGFT